MTRKLEKPMPREDYGYVLPGPMVFSDDDTPRPHPTGYSYSPTDDERHAADLLRDKGWRVDEPPCPDCRGLGYTGGYWGAQSSERCPRRCAIPAMYL